MRILGVLLLVLLATLPAAPAGGGEPAKEPVSLDGTWFVVSITGAGIKLTDADLKLDCRGFIFEKGTAKSIIGGVTVRGEGTFSADPTKTPPQIDITLAEDPRSEKQTLLGIYTLKQDRLTLCNRRKMGSPRPAEFVADDDTMLSVFERQKPVKPAG